MTTGRRKDTYVSPDFARELEKQGFSVRWGVNPETFTYGGAFVAGALVDLYKAVPRAALAAWIKSSPERLVHLIEDEETSSALRVLLDGAETLEHRSQIVREYFSGELFDGR